MASYTIKDYRTTHFEYKDLDKIHGKPDIDSLLRIFRQLKRNAQRVPTTLGGGQLGYLALVLSEVAFDNIPNSTPFVRPTLQGPFTPSNNRLSGAELSQEKAEHDEKVRLYNECQAVEQALRNQIIDAVPPEYLDSLRNSDTDMINDSIEEIITFLQTNYCRLTPEELSDREDELKKTIFDPQQPVDLMFNKIKLFTDLCTMTSNDKTDAQVVQLGYLIFNRTRAYTDALKVWNEKPATDRTYANFKTHLRKEFHALRQVGGLTMKDSSLNMLQDITNHMNQQSADLEEKINASLKANFMEAFQVLKDNTTPDENTSPPLSQALNVQTPNTQMMEMFATMQAKIDTLTTQLANGNNLGGGTPRGATSDKTINPKTGLAFKRYCHTCGCCGHWGRNCPVKKPGHKDDATFKDRKGGSDANCRPNRS